MVKSVKYKKKENISGFRYKELGKLFFFFVVINEKCCVIAGNTHNFMIKKTLKS